MLLDEHFLVSIISGIFIGAASGYLGSLMVLRRMALVGDALSHVALPGMGLALVFSINPFIGAFIFLVLAVFAIWALELKTKIPTEALVGVMFTGSLALGLLITPDAEILEALFGDISRITLIEGIVISVISILLIIFTRLIYKKSILGIISFDLAKSKGIKLEKYNFFYLIFVAIIVALGIKMIGTLLMGALVILPAVASKNIARNLTVFSCFAIVIGVISTAVGLFISRFFYFSPGPIVVLLAVAIFLVTLFFRTKN